MRLNVFEHEDADISFDPLSANRRFAGTADLAVLGTLVFAGPTRETISVMVPDCLMPPVNGTVRVDLCHHVGLSLGPAREYDQLVAGRSFREGFVSGVPRRHLGTPATCLLGRTQPHPEAVEECKQQ